MRPLSEIESDITHFTEAALKDKAFVGLVDAARREWYETYLKGEDDDKHKDRHLGGLYDVTG